MKKEVNSYLVKKVLAGKTYDQIAKTLEGMTKKVIAEKAAEIGLSLSASAYSKNEMISIIERVLRDLMDDLKAETDKDETEAPKATKKATKKASTITKVTTDGDKVVVEYSTGAVRAYKADKLPKTVKAFVDAQNEDPFFKDESSKAIFFLLYGEGELRTSSLGITEYLYMDKEAAKAWHRKMVKLVHPDNCDHPMAAKAFGEVTRIYKRMVA